MHNFIRISIITGMLLLGAVFQGTSALAADQYGYDNGFFLRSADENYMFKVRGLFNYQYLFQHNDGIDNNSALRIAKARMIFSGNAYSPDWTYYIESELATGTLGLVEYFVNWKHCDAVNVRFGQYTIPYSREGMAHDSRLLQIDGYSIRGTTVARSLTNTAFGLDREIGATVWGAVADKRLEYALSITNGEGRNAVNPAGDVDFRYAARLNYHLMGNHGYYYGDIANSETANLAVGVAGTWNRRDVDGDAAFDNILGLTADLAWGWKGWDATFEYHLGQTSLDAGGDATNHGFRGTLGYFIMPGETELAGHLAWLEPDAGFRTLQFGPVLSWFLQGRDVKLQLEYDYTMIEGAASDTTDHQVLAQAQYFF